MKILIVLAVLAGCSGEPNYAVQPVPPQAHTTPAPIITGPDTMPADWTDRCWKAGEDLSVCSWGHEIEMTFSDNEDSEDYFQPPATLCFRSGPTKGTLWSRARCSWGVLSDNVSFVIFRP